MDFEEIENYEPSLAELIQPKENFKIKYIEAKSHNRFGIESKWREMSYNASDFWTIVRGMPRTKEPIMIEIDGKQIKPFMLYHYNRLND